VGGDERRIVLGGFSQGACLTAETLVRRPRRLGGAIVWTGGLIGPPGTSWPLAPALAGMAVLVTGSDVDPFVPESRGHETARHFAACGCTVETMMLPGRPNEIADAEIAAARARAAAALAAVSSRVPRRQVRIHVDPHRFRIGVVVHRLEPHFAAVAALPDAAERRAGVDALRGTSSR
jgi:dienelactone hydrolase